MDAQCHAAEVQLGAVLRKFPPVRVVLRLRHAAAVRPQAVVRKGTDTRSELHVLLQDSVPVGGEEVHPLNYLFLILANHVDELTRRTPPLIRPWTRNLPPMGTSVKN